MAMRSAIAALKEALLHMPRAGVAHLPTPLQEVPRFARTLEGPRIFVKRDDMTGLALGGNKARKLEFVLAEAVQQQADVLIAGGGVAQSNHARLCAAAARQLGMKPVIVLQYGPEPQRCMQGNLLVDWLLGADVRLVSDDRVRKDVKPRFGLMHVMEEIATEYRKRGFRPYVLPTSSVPLAAVGYVEAALELHAQLSSAGVQADALFVTSTGSTLAGLLLGNRVLSGRPLPSGTGGSLAIQVVGISVIRLEPVHLEAVANLANGAADILGLADRMTADDVTIKDFSGEGYGVLGDEARNALLLLARTEGILLDPVYTAKGMAGLIHDIAQGRLTKDQTVVFIHTGGQPAIFAYAQELAGGFHYFDTATPP